MFGPIGTPELIIIAVVLILLFGVGKLSGLGKDLGSSIKEFRRAVKDEDQEAAEQNTSQAQAQQPAPPPAQPQQTPPNQPPSQGQQNPNDASKSNIF